MNDNHTDEQALISALEKLVPILERIQRRELTAEDRIMIKSAGINISDLFKWSPKKRIERTRFCGSQ